MTKGCAEASHITNNVRLYFCESIFLLERMEIITYLLGIEVVTIERRTWGGDAGFKS